MAYNKGDLEFKTGDEEFIMTDARAYGYDEKVKTPCAYLPHSCDYWIIGGPENACIIF